MPIQLPETILVLVLIVSLLVVVIGVGLIVGKIFSFTANLLTLVEKDRQKDAEQLKADALLEAKKIIDDANTTSLSTLKESSEKAASIIAASKAVSDQTTVDYTSSIENLTKAYETKLTTISEQILKDYESTLGEEKAKGVESTQTVVATLEKNLTAQLDTFNSNLSSQLQGLSDHITAEIAKKYEIADSDVAVYKESKMRKVDENIYKILEEVSIEVFGKVISMQDSEDFIKQVLAQKFKGA